MHLFQPSLAYTILNLVAELLAAGDEHAEYWPCSRLSVLQLFRRVFSLSFNGVLFWDSWQQDRKVQSAHFALYPRRSHWYKDTLEIRLFQSRVFFSCSKCLRSERNDCKEEFTNIPHPPEYVRRKCQVSMKRKRKCEFSTEQQFTWSQKRKLFTSVKDFQNTVQWNILKNTFILMYVPNNNVQKGSKRLTTMGSLKYESLTPKPSQTSKICTLADGLESKRLVVRGRISWRNK